MGNLLNTYINRVVYKDPKIEIPYNKIVYLFLVPELMEYMYQHLCVQLVKNQET